MTDTVEDADNPFLENIWEYEEIKTQSIYIYLMDAKHKTSSMLSEKFKIAWEDTATPNFT
jgi:hypothetical protein